MSSELATTQASNRRALLIFMAVLAVVIISTAMAVVYLQHRQLVKTEQEEFHNELTLLGELTTEALLRSDYASVENLVRRWVYSHDYISKIRAVMPNSFVLAEINKNTKVKQPLQVSQPVSFNDHTLMTLEVTFDLTSKDTGFTGIIIKTTLTALIVIMLLGWLLWNTIKRTALAPLESQIHIREQKEQELVQRTNQLEAALKELETFSYSVSHDLRAPLRAIDGFSRVILEDHSAQLDPEARGYLERVITAVQRMARLIDDLLALSRVSRRELVMTHVDLSAMAKQIIAELQEQSPERQINVAVEPGLHVRGDAQLLHVVLANLIGNAWKYTSKKPNPHIELACTLHDNEPPQYCIRDNGAGFDMQYAGKLFQPFQRLHSAEEFSGTGIGLATAARIVQRHGGRIWAEGQPGLGAIICFTLTDNETGSVQDNP